MGNSPSIGRSLWRAADQNNIEKVDEIGKWIHSHYMTRFEISEIVEWTDRRGLTPLMIAILRRNANIVRMLLEIGASVNVKNNKDKVNTALHYAAKVDSALIIDMLLAKKGNPLALNSLGLTPKDVALLRRNWKSFAVLCEAVKFFDGMLHYQVTAQQRSEYLWGNPPGFWRSRRVLLLETEDPKMVEMILIRENLPSLLVFVSKGMGVKHTTTSTGSHIVNLWGSKQKIPHSSKKFHRSCYEENLAQLGFLCPSTEQFDALYEALQRVGFEIESSPSYQQQTIWAEAILVLGEEDESRDGILPSAHAVMEETTIRPSHLIASTISLPCGTHGLDHEQTDDLGSSDPNYDLNSIQWPTTESTARHRSTILSIEPTLESPHRFTAHRDHRIHAHTHCGVNLDSGVHGIDDVLA